MARYTCVGSVRGCCGRVHRTLAASEACIAADQRGCASQGGYSDRRSVNDDTRTYSDTCKMSARVRRWLRAGRQVA